MEKIYVLELENNKFYVGKTKNLEQRIAAHKNGTGSEWTKRHPFHKILFTREVSSPHDENNITKELMMKHGIDNVRGGSYVKVSISDNERKVLEREIRAATDACFGCGQMGHFIKQCPGVEPVVEEPVVEEPVVEEPVVEEPEKWACRICKKEYTNQCRAIVHERRCEKEQKEVDKLLASVRQKKQFREFYFYSHFTHTGAGYLIPL